MMELSASSAVTVSSFFQLRCCETFISVWVFTVYE